MLKIENDIQLKTQSDAFDPSRIFKSSFVDLDKEPKPLEVLFYMGKDIQGKRVPVGTRGEFSSIVAQSKMKKSFLKSIIESAVIGGNSIKYTNEIVPERKIDGYVISIDTEQGEYYAHKTFKRVERITGERYEKYKPFQMRKINIKDRVSFIDWLVFESEFSGKIDFITIDGVADLVSNTNDLEQSVEIAEKLLKWSAEGNCHIITIIHKAGNQDKARGHLGTAIQIKAESVIFIDPITDEDGNITDNNTVQIWQGYSRGKSFEPFYLTVNQEGLPFTHEFAEDNSFYTTESNELPKPSLRDAFPENNDVPF